MPFYCLKQANVVDLIYTITVHYTSIDLYSRLCNKLPVDNFMVYVDTFIGLESVYDLTDS